MKKHLLVGLVTVLVLLLAAGYGGVAARGVEQANATPTPNAASGDKRAAAHHQG